MLIVMRHGRARRGHPTRCRDHRGDGLSGAAYAGKQRTTVGLVGNDGRVDASRLAALPSVQEIIHVTKPYKQVSREWKPESTTIRLPGGLTIGGDEVVVMAGPCSVESEQQILAAARAVRESGATILRAGAFKPRSSPYSFQGMGQIRFGAVGPRPRGNRPADRDRSDGRGGDGRRSRSSRHRSDRRPQHAELFPARKLAGRIRKPVLLKRGLSATIQELLLSAEYILAEGNPNVILVRARGAGLRSGYTRNLLDLSAIPVVHGLSHLPIIADPSHGTGHRDMVMPMANAAVAGGADGLLVEVHPTPDRALSDGAQSLYPRTVRSADEGSSADCGGHWTPGGRAGGTADMRALIFLALTLLTPSRGVAQDARPSSAARRGCTVRWPAYGPSSCK